MMIKEKGMDYLNQIRGYIEKEKGVLDCLNADAINLAMNEIVRARDEKNQIFIMGNGGSAATASHYTGDFNKGLSLDREKKFRFYCLNDNVATVLSLANDLCYEEIFVQQLKNFMDPGDIVIAISGSGNSENIIRAVRYAKEKGNLVIGLTGYDGGKLKELSDIQLHVPIHDMQITEDIHMIYDHLIMSIFYKTLAGKEHLRV